jgi:adenylate kinase
MKLVFLGMPGSGKGTIGSLVKERQGFNHISTGDLLREAVKNQNIFGVKAKNYMDEGKLVPDDIVLELLKERILELEDDAKILLDGYPRNVEQARVLKDIVKIDRVVNLVLDKEMLQKRLGGRRSCPNCKKGYNIHFMPPKKNEILCDDCDSELIQRDDDKDEVIEKRFDAYYQETEPLIDFYKNEGILNEVELTNELEDNYNKIKDILGF